MAEATIGNFDDIEEVSYVKFNAGTVRVRFTASTFIVTQNSFDKQAWLFSVVEDKADKRMSVTSLRLMLKLKNLHPLEGKVVDITRVGSDMDTDYDVEVVE